MQRAVERFVFEESASDWPLVEKVWRTRSEPGEGFISVAVTHWEMVGTRRNGAAFRLCA